MRHSFAVWQGRPKTGLRLAGRPTPHLPPGSAAPADTQEMKEGPGGEAGAFKETSQSRDQGALDAPILSQCTNQARRGSHKQPAPSLMPPLGLEKGPYFSTSTAYRRIVFCDLSRWGARSVQAFDL
jgi:hypothetical protein